MDDDALEQIGENPEQVDGCELVCEDDEILIADPRQKTWYCLKKIGPMPLLCPGGFKTGKTKLWIYSGIKCLSWKLEEDSGP